jgi:hypothetical protein
VVDTQHTKVECTWDAGEKKREKLLTNMSMWRELNESDLRQYIASSDSSDDEQDDGQDEYVDDAKRGRYENDAIPTKGAKVSGRVAKMRKLLLGEDAELDDDAEHLDDDKMTDDSQPGDSDPFNDPFFQRDEDGDDEVGESSQKTSHRLPHRRTLVRAGEMVHTYDPDESKDDLGDQEEVSV